MELTQIDKLKLIKDQFGMSVVNCITPYQNGGSVEGAITQDIFNSPDEFFLGDIYVFPYMDSSATAVVAATHLVTMQMAINDTPDLIDLNTSMSGYSNNKQNQVYKGVLSNNFKIINEQADFKTTYLMIGIKVKAG